MTDRLEQNKQTGDGFLRSDVQLLLQLYLNWAHMGLGRWLLQIQGLSSLPSGLPRLYLPYSKALTGIYNCSNSSAHEYFYGFLPSPN